MWPDRVSNPGPLTYESGALPIAPRSPATFMLKKIKNLFLLCLLTWYYDYHSLARTTPVSNLNS